MAGKNYHTNRLSSGSIGSQIFSENRDAVKASRESSNEFENLLLNPLVLESSDSVLQSPVIKEPIKEEAPVIDEEKKDVKTKPEPKRETIKKPLPAKKKTKDIVKDESYMGKRGRKPTLLEPGVAQFANCGKETYDKMTDCRYKEKKRVNEYMIDLLTKEKEAYEKNPTAFIESRRKKAEAVYKKGKEGKGSINFKAGAELAQFLEDISYELRCSKELIFRAAIETDYEKKFK